MKGWLLHFLQIKRRESRAELLATIKNMESEHGKLVKMYLRLQQLHRADQVTLGVVKYLPVQPNLETLPPAFEALDARSRSQAL